MLQIWTNTNTKKEFGIEESSFCVLQCPHEGAKIAGFSWSEH